MENSLLTECISWTGKAIEALKAEPVAERTEMILQSALGLSVMFTEGMTGQSRDALQRATEIAERIEDQLWELRTQLGLIMFHQRRVDLKSAMALTLKAKKLAKSVGDDAATAMVNSLESASQFFHGEFTKSLTLARKARQFFLINRDASQI
ncbi:hypothetical protein, partial [Treponema endosymbiont of Eucomonympha sp.]|uniref:hypothetical protein n=1 Tax=Treponema endosymbiont of Eucomonympha sp. TaxID=1580831 RepID=UPI001EE716A8